MPGITRRNFIKGGVAASGAVLLSSPSISRPLGRPFSDLKKITVSRVSSNFEREPLIRPFGFKGGYMKEIWQTVSYLESISGLHSIGLCTQSVLWSDANVFVAHSESGGNALMYSMTERAMQMLNGKSYTTPLDLLDFLYNEIYEYGKKITANPDLRKTFALNSLVGIDNALWLLYAAENGITSFDHLIPSVYKQALSHKHDKVAGIPLFAYSVPADEIRSAVEQGYFFMKIKIGQPGTQEEMLEKDKARIAEIHKAIGSVRTEHTANGRIPYYFDANGRYESKETLLRLIDHVKNIGAFDQVAVIEEPFPEEMKMDVDDIPVRLAADESAHTEVETIERIEMGYRAIALKPIAKTLSMTMKIARAAYDRNIPCFCADLTVNPVLVEWNRNFAARLSPFPGIGNLGLMESNGHQNYRNWNAMMKYHPRNDAQWTHVKNGVYELNTEYFRTGGGIFDPIPHYEEMFKSL